MKKPIDFRRGRKTSGRTTEARFWEKVQRAGADECWPWIGATDPNGYGMFYIGSPRHYTRAHRWSYEALRAEIPSGLVIDHLCRNTSCVNPWHLEPVSEQVNVRRGISPGARALRRTHCLRGHDYATHGVVRSGRRSCRACIQAYMHEYNALCPAEVARRKRLGIRVVDLDEVFGIAHRSAA